MSQQKHFPVFVFLSTNIFTASEMLHPLAASESVLDTWALHEFTHAAVNL